MKVIFENTNFVLPKLEIDLTQEKFEEAVIKDNVLYIGKLIIKMTDEQINDLYDCFAIPS